MITKEEGLLLYEDMTLGRMFENMCAQLYYREKIFGFIHLYNGQEAISTGFIKLLSQKDSIVSTYRDHVHALSKGVPARAVMSELIGKATGCCHGQGGLLHMFSKEHNFLGGFAFIGEGIPIAAGAAFTSKYKREVLKEKCDDVTVAFFGDGTCNNGQFFECLNMAALWKLPIIFVVENNLWAIGMSHLRATSDPAIWKKGPAFGMPGVHVDGMDVLKVREVAKEAVNRARTGEGPTLVECETYRFRGHSLADSDDLRDPAEKARYRVRDPIDCLKKYLIENKLASEADLKAIEKKIDELVEEAVEFADQSPAPLRSQLLENVFADPKGFGIGLDANEIEPNNKEIGREMIRLRKVMIREPDAIGKETKVEESMHLQMGDDQRSQVRTFTPKNHIMMETLHKLSLREAVVSHSTPSSSVVEDDDTNKKTSSFVNEKENDYVDADADQVHSPRDSTYIKGEYQVQVPKEKDTSVPGPRNDSSQRSLEFKSKVRRNKNSFEAIVSASSFQRRRIRERTRKQIKSLHSNHAYPIIKSNFHAGYSKSSKYR
uniref:Pyruvate dehydrogenase E1 component subunit alpha n=1 Tax=Chenopodium quinoa TaxID=63459 RepID=A0A803LPH5_CHEQI